jgi:phosphoribosylformylglycinamidine (FGAM) synthase PurS component
MLINLRVWLKIPDAEAATVKNTLVRRLGYGNVLGDVKKERIFSIQVDSGDPEELARPLPASWSMRTRRAIRS